MHKLKQLEKFWRQNILLKSNELAVECVVKKWKSNKELRIIDFQRYINEKLEELDYKVWWWEFEWSSNRRWSKRKKKNPYWHQYKLPPWINPDSL